MTQAAIAVDGGALTLGGGLLALVRPALDRLAPGGVLAILSTASSVGDDLASWCRLEHHEYLGSERGSDGPTGHLVRPGALAIPRRVDAVERADPATGFAPRGARVEPGGPRYPFSLVERDRATAPGVAQLYEQACAAQWDAREIAWHKLPTLPDALEAAVVQVMSFLAENELAALYVPSRFLARVHPAFVETAQFLATQLADEARHIDVFLRRAHARGDGSAAIASATTSHSLLSLLELEDLTEASFLLGVLGEGTFLDLLRFVEEHAPDEVTAEVARRARVDEARHVHFGMTHVRHALAGDATLGARLEAAVRRRAATLAGAGASAPAPLVDALTVLAARGTDPPSIARGHERVRELLATMHASRTSRLVTAGFSDEDARRISELHTPNLM